MHHANPVIWCRELDHDAREYLEAGVFPGRDGEESAPLAQIPLEHSTPTLVVELLNHAERNSGKKVVLGGHEYMFGERVSGVGKDVLSEVCREMLAGNGRWGREMKGLVRDANHTHLFKSCRERAPWIARVGRICLWGKLLGYKSRHKGEDVVTVKINEEPCPFCEVADLPVGVLHHVLMKNGSDDFFGVAK